MLISEITTPTRYPGLLILANGVPLNGSRSAQITSTNYLSADSFKATIALGIDPGFDATFWSSTADIKIDIRVSADGTSAPQSLLQGNVDLVSIEPLQGLVVIEGRDFTSLLLQARTQDTFANRTSSEIATILAQRAGLSPIVTATTTLVGRYYQEQHARVTLDQFSRTTTDWDLLVFLAKQEAFDLFVQAQSLYFQPPPPTSASASIVLDVADVETLRLDREMTLAGPISVAVKSWNTTQQTMVAGNASNAGTSAANTQNYVVIQPNLSSSQANQLAQSKLNELLGHERTVVARLPGEMTIYPRTLVQLQGTGTTFDQIYTVDEVIRRLDFSHGFTQVVRMRAASVTGPSIPGSLTAVSING